MVLINKKKNLLSCFSSRSESENERKIKIDKQFDCPKEHKKLRNIKVIVVGIVGMLLKDLEKRLWEWMTRRRIKIIVKIS